MSFLCLAYYVVYILIIYQILHSKESNNIVGFDYQIDMYFFVF